VVADTLYHHLTSQIRQVLTPNDRSSTLHCRLVNFYLCADAWYRPGSAILASDLTHYCATNWHTIDTVALAVL